jgi:hypothetical protein
MAHDGNEIELLKDTRFAIGFCGSPSEVIPPGSAGPKAWRLNEGVHRDYTDEFGRHVEMLTEHRMVVNHVMAEDTPQSLCVCQYNNRGMKNGDPRWNSRLIRRLRSDRRGTVRMYFNTANEIRNAATGYGSKWANDTWPHFLFEQSMDPPRLLADVRRIDLSFDVRILSAGSLPTRVPGMTGPGTLTVPTYCHLRERDRPDHTLYVGHMLYSDRDGDMNPFIGREQYGVVFYRRMPDNWDGVPEIGEKRRCVSDIKSLVREVIARYDEGVALSRNADDYLLDGWNFGYEIIGHWEAELELSNVSLRAVP